MTVLVVSFWLVVVSLSECGVPSDKGDVMAPRQKTGLQSEGSSCETRWGGQRVGGTLPFCWQIAERMRVELGEKPGCVAIS